MTNGPVTSKFVPSPNPAESQLPKSPKVRQGVWNWLTTPLISEERAATTPEWIRPAAQFGAKYFTDPLTIGITLGTAGLGGPAALALRTAARGLPKGLSLGAKILAAGIEPVAYLPKGTAVGTKLTTKGKKVATAAGTRAGFRGISGQFALGLAGETALTAGAAGGQELGTRMGGTPGAIIGGLAGGLAGAASFGAVARKSVGATMRLETRIDTNQRNTKNLHKSGSEPDFKKYQGSAKNEAKISTQVKRTSDVQDEFDASLYVRAARALKDWATARKFGALVNKPGALLSGLAGKIDPRFTAKWLPEYARIIRTTTSHSIDNLGGMAENWLNYNGTADTIFGRIIRSSTKEHGAIMSGDLAPDMIPKELLGDLENITLQNIAANLHLKEWDALLSPERKEWLRRAAELEKAGLDRMKEVGINVKEINFDAYDAFGTKNLTKEQADALQLSPAQRKHINDVQYAGRGMLAKFDAEGNLVGKALKGSGDRIWSIGNKVSSEKPRTFDSVVDAEREGYRYISYDEYVVVNYKARMKRAADEELKDWIIKNAGKEDYGGIKGLRITTEAEEIGWLTNDPNWVAIHNDLGKSSRMSDKIALLLKDHIEGEGKFELSRRNLKELSRLKDQNKVFARLLEIKDGVFNKEVPGVDHLRQVIIRFPKAVKEQLDYGNKAKAFALQTRIAQIKRLIDSSRINEARKKAMTNPYNLAPVKALNAKAKKVGWEKIKNEEIEEVYKKVANYPGYRKLIEGNDAYLIKQDFHGAAQQFVEKWTPELKNSVEGDIGRTFDNYVPPGIKNSLSEGQKVRISTEIYDHARKMRNLWEVSKKEMKKLKSEANNSTYSYALAREAGLQGKYLRFKDVDPKRMEAVTDFRKDFEGLEESMQISSFWDNANKLNAFQRTLALAGDGSLFAIQLITLPMTHPIIFAKTGKRFFSAALKSVLNGSDRSTLGEWHAKFITDNVDLIRKFPGLQLSTRNEFFEALDQNGLLDGRLFSSKLMTPVRKGYKAFLTPFQDGFIAAQDFAGIELLKALEPTLGRNPSLADRRSIVNFVNSIRGLSDSAAKGISQKQRAIESAILLAPRYRRATAALYVMALDPNSPGGRQARQSILALTAGVTMAAVAIQIAVSAQQDDTMEELEEKLEDMFDPKKGSFMMIQLPNDVKVGPGSKFISDFRLLAKAANSVATDKPLQDYQDFLAADRDNPGLKWLQGQMALAPQTAIDALRGTDFMGEPIYRGGNSLEVLQNSVGNPLKENMLPIWFQEVLESNAGVVDPLEAEADIGGRFTRGLGEFWGLRTTPKGVHNMLHDASYIHMDKPWDSLMPFEKDLVKYLITEKIAERRQKQMERSTTDMQIYFNDLDKLKKEFNETMGRLAESYDIYPLTSVGNRSYNFRYQNEKYAYRKAKNKMADSILFEEQDTESPDPGLRALAQYYKLFDESENEDGDFVGAIFEAKYNKLFATWTPEQRKIVRMSRYKDPVDMRVYNRLKVSNRKEAARMTEAWNLRIKHYEDMGRQDLAEFERKRFLQPVVPLEDR